MKTETVKGFQDFTGEEAEKRAVIREVIRQVFERRNFEQVETPIVEYEEFVKGYNACDEAISDIFKLQDRGKRKLALRYEFTFQLKRLAENKKLPYKRFQIGPTFRDEPVSSNRFRQFTQCDIDIVGSSVKDEAEVLAAAKEILDALKIDSVIYFNNRKLLNEILDEIGVQRENKEDAIREIDKLEKLGEKEVRENLKKFGAEKLIEIVKGPVGSFRKYESFKEIEALAKECKLIGVDVRFVPSLARGLAYYNGSVFELKSKRMKESIGAGGSYIFNNIQSTGISFGLERLAVLTKMIVKIDKYLVVSLNEDRKALALAQKIRKSGKNVSVYYGKPSKALEYANAYKINNVIFVGAKEIKKKMFRVKNMRTGKEKVLILREIEKKNISLKKR